MVKEDEKKVGLMRRPPIVAFLGHVDHGKTSLLDKIRQARVAEKEAGGITQGTGVYQTEIDGKKITFIDTPGHQAFSAMRSRGANVADIVVLVVAADDGVMPQTIESVEHIRMAGVPFLVAINKVDLPQADVERVKLQLSNNGVLVEGYEGDVVCVPVSAKNGDGIKDLLEMILLVAEMNNVSADPNGPFFGVIVESRKDRRGTVGTVIIKNGTLRVGDQIQALEVSAKIKGMFDQNGGLVDKAIPGDPVEVLGFSEIPPVGAQVIKSESTTKKMEDFAHQSSVTNLSPDDNKFRIIFKANSQGSLEAITSSLPVGVVLVLSSVGDITEGDILLSQSARAEIWGFNIKVSSGIEKLAETEKVVIRTFKIIYDFLDELDKRITELVMPIKEEIIGKAEIIAEFFVEGDRIAGCKVMEGKIVKDENLRLTRSDRLIGDTKIISMRHMKEEIDEAKKGGEFGLNLSPALDFKVGDVIVCYRPAPNKLLHK